MPDPEPLDEIATRPVRKRPNTKPPVLPLIVDGPRPSVAWVAALPAQWTPSKERQVLFALACDAFNDVSSPTRDQLGKWSGVWQGDLSRALAALELPELLRNGETRPALIERLDDSGNVLPPGQYVSGRHRTRYRLLVNVTPGEPFWDSRTVPGEHVDNAANHSEDPERLETVPDEPNRSGQPFGTTVRDNRSGIPERLPSLPFPFPITSSSQVQRDARKRTASRRGNRDAHEQRQRQTEAEVNAERSRQLAALEQVMAAAAPEVGPAPQESPADDDGGMQ